MSAIPSLIEHFPYIGFFILLILGGIGLPFPEDATLILCGFLISHGVVRLIPSFIIIYSGVLLTDFLVYSAGKKYGRMIVTHKRFHKIISPERLSTLEDKFNKRGMLIILFGRHMIGLRAQIFLVAGVIRMSPLKFIMADAISSTVTIAVMVGVGFVGGNSLQIIRKDIVRVEHIAILLIVALFTIYLLFRYFKSRRDKTPP